MHPKLQRWLLNRYQAIPLPRAQNDQKMGIATSWQLTQDETKMRKTTAQIQPSLFRHLMHARPGGCLQLNPLPPYLHQNLMLKGEPGGSRRSRRNCVDSECSRMWFAWVGVVFSSKSTEDASVLTDGGARGTPRLWGTPSRLSEDEVRRSGDISRSL